MNPPSNNPELLNKMLFDEEGEEVNPGLAAPVRASLISINKKESLEQLPPFVPMLTQVATIIPMQNLYDTAPGQPLIVTESLMVPPSIVLTIESAAGAVLGNYRY